MIVWGRTAMGKQMFLNWLARLPGRPLLPSGAQRPTGASKGGGIDLFRDATAAHGHVSANLWSEKHQVKHLI